jgi:glycogen debranching enzyme
MQVLHKVGNVNVAKDVGDGAAFLLGNKKAGYAYFSSGKKSRYNGVFFNFAGKMMRVVAELGIEKPAEKIVNRLYSAERHSSGNREAFFMPIGSDSLAYLLESEDWITLSLDVRGIYEPSDGTAYELSKNETSITVKCKRGTEEYFLAIVADKLEYEPIGQYAPVTYESDKERNSPPFEGAVYRALKIKSKKLVLSFSNDPQTAYNNAQQVYNNLPKLYEEAQTRVRKMIRNGVFASEDVWMAYNCCINSLDQLTASDRVIAGFPWFFQPWTRDELISITNLSQQVKKDIILRDIQYLKDDGRIPNILAENAQSNADSVGWLFTRMDDSMKVFTVNERNIIREKIVESIMRLNVAYVRDLLVCNGPKETWMDSQYSDNGRAGARIEIQALTLRTYQTAYRLTKNEKFSRLAQLTEKKVKKEFWNGRNLSDGAGDPTIRPNVFIAAYVYFGLLKKDEWETCFDSILQNLWCEWGGLSSIDKKNPLFCPNSTGEDARSYHRGDSWYFLNNMAALVLHRTNAEKYRPYVEAVLKASTEDILWKGMAGHHSEISSAAIQKAEGCGAQAWSAAMYIELVNELYPAR